jgi:hypothetical protein
MTEGSRDEKRPTELTFRRVRSGAVAVSGVTTSTGRWAFLLGQA